MHPVDGQVANVCVRTRQKQKSGAAPDAKTVLGSFNTWAFKREQPDDSEQLLQSVARHLVNDRPIEFVLYWGKGPRQEIATPEIACLEYLVEMSRRISEQYRPGASIRLICTDTHALLNGHSHSSIRSYFGQVGEAAVRRGFRWCLLGDLTRGQSGNFAHVCPAERPLQTIQQLERSAARWYQGSGKPVDGAIAYFDLNMVEKRAVELEFPNAIFITFSGSEMRALFPDMLPIFYMYSVRKGVSVKPWFIIDDNLAVAATG